MAQVRAPDRTSFDKLSLIDRTCQFAYSSEDGGGSHRSLHFIDPETMDEFVVPRALFGKHIPDLIESGTEIKVRLREDDDRVVEVALPRHLKCTVTEILESYCSGDKRYHHVKCLL